MDESRDCTSRLQCFNISVARDPVGVWWLYFNKTNKKCLEEWGSKRVLPKEQIGTQILPESQQDNKRDLLPPSLMLDTKKRYFNSANLSDILQKPEQLDAKTYSYNYPPGKSSRRQSCRK